MTLRDTLEIKRVNAVLSAYPPNRPRQTPLPSGWEPLSEELQRHYPGYVRETNEHTLKLKTETEPAHSPSNYSGYKLTLCSAEAALGNRIEIMAHDISKESDQFSSENLFAFTKKRKNGKQESEGIIPARMIVLNQDAGNGRICLYAGNRSALLGIADYLDNRIDSHLFGKRWLSSRCEEILNAEKKEPVNTARCETLIKNLNYHLGRKSVLETFTETSGAALSFATPAGAAVFLGWLLYKFKKNGSNNGPQPPKPPLPPIIPSAPPSAPPVQSLPVAWAPPPPISVPATKQGVLDVLSFGIKTYVDGAKKGFPGYSPTGKALLYGAGAVGATAIVVGAALAAKAILASTVAIKTITILSTVGTAFWLGAQRFISQTPSFNQFVYR